MWCCSYTVPEYEATRESYRRTVKNAEACNISFVTPWLWLGGGERRRVTDKHDADTGGDPAWNYDIAYSWMLGREINDPFYAKHPLRFAPWNRARRIALYPNPLDASCLDSSCHSSAWLVPPVINASTGAAVGGDVLSSVTLRHFVAYVKGAAGIRLNDTTVATKTKTDDTTATPRSQPAVTANNNNNNNNKNKKEDECNLVAYGSNSISILMSVTGRSEEHLCERCWPVELNEHLRIYSVFADVWPAGRCESEAGDEVRCPPTSGMICELVEEDCVKVDRREGTPTLYTREFLSGAVVSNYTGCPGGALECPYPKPAQVYFKVDKTWSRPSDSYMCSVHTMFKQIGLSAWDGGDYTDSIDLWAKVDEDRAIAESRGRFSTDGCTYTPRCGRP